MNSLICFHIQSGKLCCTFLSVNGNLSVKGKWYIIIILTLIFTPKSPWNDSEDLWGSPDHTWEAQVLSTPRIQWGNGQGDSGEGSQLRSCDGRSKLTHSAGERGIELSEPGPKRVRKDNQPEAKPDWAPPRQALLRWGTAPQPRVVTKSKGWGWGTGSYFSEKGVACRKGLTAFSKGLAS